ncbi:MAG: type II toxin-antitoxin system RelE/ParE family toxin [Gaiellaceae bacterium]
MARVLVAPTAWDGLASLIRTHSLPADTTDRVKRSLQPLARFPQLGRELEGGRWDGFRFILGPWPWLIILYRYDPAADVVMVVLIEDGRAATSSLSRR